MWVVVVVAVVVATVIVEGVLVEVDCVGVISELGCGGFVVVVVLEDSGLVLWSSWRMTLWCWYILKRGVSVRFGNGVKIRWGRGA